MSDTTTPRARHPAKCPKCAHPALIYSDATTLILSVRQHPTWTRKISGRTITRTLTAEDAERLRPYFEAHRHLRQLITELEAISIQLAGQPRPPRTQPGDQPA